MSLCVGEYPYFAFRKRDEALKPKLSKSQKLGIGYKPSGAVVWLTRSTPKNKEEWTNKPIQENRVLVGYHLKNLIEYGKGDASSDAVLFINNKREFELFSKMYGVDEQNKIDWDKVRKQWGGLELRASYLPEWQPYRAAVWNSSALEDIELCPKSLKERAIFITYGLPYCPYSVDVLTTLKQLKIPHKNYYVKEHEKEYYKELHGWETFPHVFLVGKDDKMHLVGGSDDFHALLRSMAN